MGTTNSVFLARASAWNTAAPVLGGTFSRTSAMDSQTSGGKNRLQSLTVVALEKLLS